MLRIKSSSVAVLTRGTSSSSLADVLESRASQTLDSIAEGGMIIPVQEVQEIEDNYGKGIETSKDIVRATEGKATKREGQMLLTATIDPAYEIPLREIADRGGRTLEEHMSEVFAWGMEQGWFNEIPPPGTRRIFTPDQEKWLSREIGLDGFSVAELIAHIKNVKRTKGALKEVESGAIEVQ